MSPRFFVLPLVLGAAALLTAGDDRPSFHGVHEGTERSGKLPYEFMYSGAMPLSESEDGRSLLEGCFAAYGGREHLARLESFRLVHDLESEMYASGRIERTIATGRRYRIERENDVRTLDGGHAWSQRKEAVVELGEQRYRSELFSYLTMRLPMSLEAEGFDEPRFATRGGDPLGYLFFEKPDTLMIVVGIDPETFLIHTSEGIIRSGDGIVVYINRFAEHEEFDGYVFPTQMTNVSLGMEVGQSKLISVDVNCETRNSEFDLGGAGVLREGR